MTRTSFIKSLFGIGLAATLPSIPEVKLPKSQLDKSILSINKLKAHMNVVWESKNLNLINFELIEESKKIPYELTQYYIKCNDIKHDIDLVYNYVFSIVKYKLLINDYAGARGILSFGKQMLRDSADKNIVEDYYKFNGKLFNDEFISLCKEVCMDDRIKKLSI